MKTICGICRKDDECRHIPLYVFGSEGLWLCHNCEMRLVDHVRKEILEYQRARLDAALSRKITLET
jgi:hypothetical protein